MLLHYLTRQKLIGSCKLVLQNRNSEILHESETNIIGNFRGLTKIVFSWVKMVQMQCFLPQIQDLRPQNIFTQYKGVLTTLSIFLDGGVFCENS